MNNIGKALRIWRQEQNLKQEDVAHILDISRNYISMIERGKAENLSFSIHSKICELIGMPITPESEDSLKKLFVEMYTTHYELAGVIGSDHHMNLTKKWRERYVRLSGHFVWP